MQRITGYVEPLMLSIVLVSIWRMGHWDRNCISIDLPKVMVNILGYVHRVHLQCLDKLQKWVAHIKTRKNFIGIYFSKQFSRYSPNTCSPQSYRVFPAGKLENPSVFSSKLKLRDTLSMHLLRFSNHSQQPWHLWKGETFLTQMSSCVQWFRWRTFWAFLVTCDLASKNNSAIIK